MMSGFTFKKSVFGFLDMLKFKQIVPLRRKTLASGSDEPFSGVYGVNRLAEQFHPKKQEFRIVDIREFPGADAKSYLLQGDSAAPFRPGQYTAVDLAIGDSVLTRAYTIASDPADAARGVYELGVKRSQGGFASSWILDHWKIGDTVRCSGPEGFCCYEPLRDEAHVVGVAGGIGITLFLSMARSVASGKAGHSLTLFYGCRTADSILYRRELDALGSAGGRLKVVYVLSDEERAGYEHGFVTAELVRKYVGDRKFSLFLCGPRAMCEHMQREARKLGLDRKHVRVDSAPCTDSPTVFADYRGDANACYRLTVCGFDGERTIPALSSETVLTALDRAGIKAPAHCRGGECGFCRSKRLEGECFVPAMFDRRRAADAPAGYIHPCCTYPLSDMKLLLWDESEG